MLMCFRDLFSLYHCRQNEQTFLSVFCGGRGEKEELRTVRK